MDSKGDIYILVTEMVMGGIWEGLSSVPSALTPGEIERVKSSQMLKSQAPIREDSSCSVEEAQWDN